MSDTTEMACAACRKEYPVSELKYVRKGDRAMIALCPSCRFKLGISKTPPVQPKPNGARGSAAMGTRLKPVVEKKMKKEEDEEKESYYCERCKYSFRFRPNTETNLKCPYCGKTDKLKHYDL